MNALDLLDSLRTAAIRGDVLAVHDVLGAIHNAEPTASERSILDPSIEQSIAILDGRTPRPSPLRVAAQATRQIACFVVLGLAYRAWLVMPW